MTSSALDDRKQNGISVVLDSSALLALAQAEIGAPIVASAVAEGAAMSTVNLSETYAVLAKAGASLDRAQVLIAALELTIFPFDEDFAMRTAALRVPTMHAGLSLGDRACLALARSLGVRALTGDKQWTNVDVGVELQLIR